MERLTLESSPVQRALQIFVQTASAPAIRAEAALNLLLAGINVSPWQEVAWAFSSLTGDGFPIEFTFASSDTAIRYTTEIAGPEVDEREKLARAEQFMMQLEPGYSDGFSAIFRQIQSAGVLNYGVWMSGRHGAENDRYKLYIEVPKEGMAQAMLLLNQIFGRTDLLNRLIELRLIGYEPAASRLEFYFYSQDLQVWEVKRLLNLCGLVHQEAALLSLLDLCFEGSLERILPRIHMGFSLSVSLTGEATVFSLFSPARSIWGGDGAIRRALRSISDQRNWNWESYVELSQPISAHTGWKTRHGAMSFVAMPQGDAALYVSLRPP
jgi:hypothetical protein